MSKLAQEILGASKEAPGSSPKPRISEAAAKELREAITSGNDAQIARAIRALARMGDED